MKKLVYTGARRSRYLFTPLSLGLIFLPMLTMLGVMFWGEGFALPFWVGLILLAVLLYSLSIVRQTIRKLALPEEQTLARWTYDPEFWKAYRKAELRPSWPSFLTQTIICILLFLFFIAIPRIDTVYAATNLDARVDAVVLMALLVWISSLVRKWNAMRYPGEVILTAKGYYSRYGFTSWGGKDIRFDGSAMEHKAHVSFLSVHYRIVKGLSSRTQMVELSIPVPRDYIAQAEAAVKQMNKQHVHTQ